MKLGKPATNNAQLEELVLGHSFVPPEEESRVYVRLSELPHCERLYIFDGDDTLWEDNLYYNQITAEVIAHIESFAGKIDSEAFQNILNEVERRVIAREGFGPIGFEKSIREAFSEFVQTINVAIPIPDHIFDEIVLRLRSIPCSIEQDVIDTLSELKNRGDGLVLFTSGPLHIQKEKIERASILKDYFHAVSIAPIKNKDAYDALRREFREHTGRVIVVGNSLYSDVQAAVAAGLEAVHYLNKNSWSQLSVGVRLEKFKYQTVSSLREIAKLTEKPASSSSVGGFGV